MGIGIDGIATGIDTTALIGALTEAASGPKNSLLARIDDYEDKNEKITELINLIGDMEDSLEDIEDVGDFRSFKASYEENDAFDVSVDGEAVAGTYDITVGSIAKAELEISQGYASRRPTGWLERAPSPWTTVGHPRRGGHGGHESR